MSGQEVTWAQGHETWSPAAQGPLSARPLEGGLWGTKRRGDTSNSWGNPPPQAAVCFLR